MAAQKRGSRERRAIALRYVATATDALRVAESHMRVIDSNAAHLETELIAKAITATTLAHQHLES